MADLLLTGLSGLKAFKSVLNTTSHNIANAQTEGFSRQRVELDSLNPQLGGGGYIGSGVTTTSIDRIYDTFLSTQFRSSSSAASELDTYFNFATQVDSVLANQNVGLSASLQDFFNAVQAVADDPASLPARQVLLSEGGELENRFGTLDHLFNEITSQLNGSLKGNVSDINNLAENIASLNNKIVTAIGMGGGQQPNDMLDQRDLLIDKLSKLVNVNTSPQENGAVNVFIGNGQSLVLGTTHNTLAVQQKGFDVSAVDIVFTQGNNNTVITQFMTGGEVGGTLRFRDEVLDPSINTLGQVATSLAFAVNKQHENGIDLDGQQGQDFFNAPVITPNKLAGTGSLDVVLANTENLTTSDYSLTYDGTTYNLTRLSDNTSFSITNGNTVDGLTFDLSGVANGDSYRIRPTRTAASEFGLTLADPRDIAAALPVISEVAAGNQGTGGINSISIENLSTASLPSPPALSSVTLSYNNLTNGYDITGTGTGAGAQYLGASFVPYDSSIDNGKEYTLNIASFGDVKFTLTGQPNNADSFQLIDNIDGVGDNRNANLLSGLQTSPLLSGGKATLQESYGQIVADVGRRTQSAEANGLAQNGLLMQTIASKESISGVNLDEEAANLVRFQQAYQAASQVVLTSRTIFDTLLGAFR